MAVFRVNKNTNYTVMSNYHLRDKNLSLKAKGLLSLMLSLPPSWDYSVAGLCAICKEGREAVQTALKELESNNYLVRTREHAKSGKFGYIYDIYEKPRTVQPQTGNPCTVNPQQINKDKINKDKTNKDKESTHAGFEMISKNKEILDQPKEAILCAQKLRDRILEIYPNNAGARKGDCVDRWAKDIEKMNRLDGRSWENIEKAIEWALNDSFWQKNIWSGANLRKHYDRLEADARADFMKHGTITVGI